MRSKRSHWRKSSCLAACRPWVLRWGHRTQPSSFIAGKRHPSSYHKPWIQNNLLSAHPMSISSCRNKPLPWLIRNSAEESFELQIPWKERCLWLSLQNPLLLTFFQREKMLTPVQTWGEKGSLISAGRENQPNHHLATHCPLESSLVPKNCKSKTCIRAELNHHCDSSDLLH